MQVLQHTTKDETTWLHINSEFGMKIKFSKKHLDVMIIIDENLHLQHYAG